MSTQDGLLEDMQRVRAAEGFGERSSIRQSSLTHALEETDVVRLALRQEPHLQETHTWHFANASPDPRRSFWCHRKVMISKFLIGAVLLSLGRMLVAFPSRSYQRARKHDFRI
jgi:hypothetical protein